MTQINLEGGSSLYLPSGYAEFAIRYKQGKRTMYLVAPNPYRLADMTKDTQVYDPRSESDDVSNRLQNRPHIRAIGSYLGENPDKWILGAMVVYVKPEVLQFKSLTGSADKAMGILDIPEGVPFFAIGDGQHRALGYKEVFKRHPSAGDPVRQALLASGQPVIIVEEPSAAQASMDFVDLATTKPIPSSLRAALDKRKKINLLSMEVAQEVKLFDVGDRVEFLRASVSKNSKKLFAFASLKFAVATMLIGFSQRTATGIEAATDPLLTSDYDGRKAFVVDAFNELSELLPGWADIVDGSMDVPTAKDRFVSCTSAGLTAIAGALFRVVDNQESVPAACQRMAEIDWRKLNRKTVGKKEANDVFFEGTILQEGLTVSNRPSFESAADKLYEAIAE
jgi:DGQHR domain-containing protein